MKTILRGSIFLFSLLLIFSCSLENQKNKNLSDNTQNGTSSTSEQVFSIVGKWYFNPSDDRYSYDFNSSGTLYYHYYQSSPGRFVTATGNWSYLNSEHKLLLVRLPDNVDSIYFTIEGDTNDAWYNIIDKNSAEIVVERDPGSPSGRGFGTITELSKSITAPSLILPELVGTWYYDESKDGKWLKFDALGNCYYYHYQTFPGGGNWTVLSGIWNYNKTSNSVVITMRGSSSVSCSIGELTGTSLILSPGIYSGSRFYK